MVLYHIFPTKTILHQIVSPLSTRFHIPNNNSPVPNLCPKFSATALVSSGFTLTGEELPPTREPKINNSPSSTPNPPTFSSGNGSSAVNRDDFNEKSPSSALNPPPFSSGADPTPSNRDNFNDNPYLNNLIGKPKNQKGDRQVDFLDYFILL